MSESNTQRQPVRHWHETAGWERYAFSEIHLRLDHGVGDNPWETDREVAARHLRMHQAWELEDFEQELERLHNKSI